MNKVKVLFFATLKDKAGVAEAQLDLAEGADVLSLKQALFQKFENLPRAGSSMLVAVNKEYAFDGDLVPNGAEIALFPPVSGG
jgi:molybdopterin converting factor subunit 1